MRLLFLMISYFNVLDYITGYVFNLLLLMVFQIYLAVLDLNFKHIPSVRCCVVLP